jgi:hypothetical protein
MLPMLSVPSRTLPRAEPQHDRGTERHHQSRAQAVDTPHQCGPLLRRDGHAGVLLQSFTFATLLRERLYYRNARERLLNMRLNAGFDFALHPGCRAQRLADQEGRPDDERREASATHVSSGLSCAIKNTIAPIASTGMGRVRRPTLRGHGKRSNCQP